MKRDIEPKSRDHARTPRETPDPAAADDALLRELRALPARDADADVAERVRRGTADAFDAAHDASGSAWRRMLGLTARALPPLVVVGTVSIYLAWAVSTANALFGQ